MNKSKIIISIEEKEEGQLELACHCPSGSSENITALANHIAEALPQTIAHAVKTFYTKNKD